MQRTRALGPPASPRARSPYRSTVSMLSALLAGALLVACAGPSAEDRAGAKDGLAQVRTFLAEVSVAYAEGDYETAYELAEQAGSHTYCTPEVEGVIERTAPAVDRELDPLLEATIPAAIDRRVTVEELEEMLARADVLIGRAEASLV